MNYLKSKLNHMVRTSRRRFISNTGKTMLAGGFMTATDGSQSNELKDQFVHHVFFWLKNKESKEDLDKLVAGLKKLSGVKTIRQYQIGKPAETKRDVIDSSYSISWLTLFDNKADQDSYQS